MPFLLLTVILICAACVILTIVARLLLLIEVKTPPTTVARKTRMGLVVRIKNRFIMPLTPVRVYVKVCEKDKSEPQKKMLIVCLAPFGEVTLNIQNTFSFRGEYTVGLEKTEIFDILKIIKFSIICKTPWNVISVPRELTLRDLRDNNQDDTEVSRTKPFGFNKDAFSHLREYRAGESLRHIHWKLSARLPENELIIKQMESNHDYSSLVFCDFTAPTETPADEFLYISDLAIEASTALIRRILMNGNTALFIWQDVREDDVFTQENSVRVKEVADSFACDELTACLATLPAQPFDIDKGEFIDLFEEYADEIRLERSIFIVTANISEELVEKLRSTGLILRENLTLALIIASELTEEQKNLTEYLQTQTKISICRIEKDEDSDIESFNEVTVL
jgi:hypothetical protein